MNDPREKLTVFERVLSSLGVLFLGLSFIPGISLATRVTLGCYLIELVAYLAVPWEYWRWNEKEKKRIAAKQVIGRFHRRLFIAWFWLSLSCLVGGITVKFLPEIADELILNHFVAAAQNVVMANTVTKLPLPSPNPLDATKSTIGVIEGQTLELLPTPTLGAALLKMSPASRWPSNIAAVGLAFLFAAALYIWHQEKLMGIAIGS